jgi:hypothetical protein
MDDSVKALLIVYGPIIALVYFIILSDWIARRRARRPQNHKAA